MDTDVARTHWHGVARITCGVLLGGAILFLAWVDVGAAEARDALLGTFVLMLAITAVSFHGSTSLDGGPERPTEGAAWHEHDGAFRGMVG